MRPLLLLLLLLPRTIAQAPPFCNLPSLPCPSSLFCKPLTTASITAPCPGNTPGLCVSCLSSADCPSPESCIANVCDDTTPVCNSQLDCPDLTTSCILDPLLSPDTAVCISDGVFCRKGGVRCEASDRCVQVAQLLPGICRARENVCEGDDECEGGRCIALYEGSICVPAGAVCGEGEGECGEGEVCLGVDVLGVSFCVQRVEGEQAVESLGPGCGEVEASVEVGDDEMVEDGEEEQAVCVDARLLDGWGREVLVFEQDRRARMLCDGWGSCATAGHMVVWRGVGMMMRKYCEEVDGGCVEEVGWVNSPRWKWGLRVGTGSPGLEFAAVAARWATRVEERVLSRVIAMGA